MNLAYDSVKRKTRNLAIYPSKYITSKGISPYILSYRAGIARSLNTTTPLGVIDYNSVGLGQAPIEPSPVANRNTWGSLSTVLTQVGDIFLAKERSKTAAINARLSVLSQGSSYRPQTNLYLGAVGLSLLLYLLVSKRKRGR